ncbi:MAG: hypothetical protein IKO49_00440 [Bacilli bacterium]|nr:hypothetical protein [Bacilli bacterium]
MCKKDVIYLLSNSFHNNLFKKYLIAFLYFPNLFKNNYRITNYYEKYKGFFYKLQNTYNRTMANLKDINFEFEKRLFFYNINKFNFKIYYTDFVNISVVILIFVLSITL